MSFFLTCMIALNTHSFQVLFIDIELRAQHNSLEEETWDHQGHSSGQKTTAQKDHSYD